VEGEFEEKADQAIREVSCSSEDLIDTDELNKLEAASPFDAGSPIADRRSRKKADSSFLPQ